MSGLTLNPREGLGLGVNPDDEAGQIAPLPRTKGRNRCSPPTEYVYEWVVLYRRI